jgi:hypothetical protein
MNNITKLNIADMEVEDFDNLLEELDKNISDTIEKDEESEYSPDDKIEAREWLSLYVQLGKEIDFLKEELIPHLQKKYIEPNLEKIDKNEKRRETLRDGLLLFLEKIGEKKVNYPELGTVSWQNAKAKILYPEDEKSFLEKLVEQKSDYVTYKPSIDKKKIQMYFSENDEVPISSLSVERGGKTLVIKGIKK